MGDIAAFLVVIIPLVSLALGFTVRFTIKPLIELLAGAIRETKLSPAPETAQIEALTTQVALLTDAVTRLQQKVEFDQALGVGASETPRLGDPGR